MSVDPENFINTFHRWVREEAVAGLLIDVADYRHVPHGPGVLLVGHDVDYAMDHRGGRWGLLLNRKTVQEGSNSDRLREALGAAFAACALLEEEYPPLRFSRQELEILVNDRALAPNSAETRGAAQAELTGLLSGLLGHEDFTLTPETDARRRLGVTVKSGQPVELAALR